MKQPHQNGSKEKVLFLHKKLNLVLRRALMLSVVSAIFLFTITNLIYTQKAIYREGAYLSDLVFDRLYSSMTQGWDKHSIDEIFQQLNKRSPDIQLHLHRSDSLVQQYGVRTGTTISPEELQWMNKTTEAEMVQYSFDRGVTFHKRLIFNENCLYCHTQNHKDETAGVLSVNYPLSSVRIGLWGGMLTTFSAITFSIMCCFWLTRKYIAKEIEISIDSLVDQIDQISTHNDLNTEVNIDSDIIEIKKIEKAFNQKNERLRKAYQDVAVLSLTDPLTGLFNRNKLTDALAKELSRNRRYGTEFSLVMMDLDGFKGINDKYGHDAGDFALKTFANLLRKHLRPTDVAVRLGGDEFLILLTHTNKEQAEEFRSIIQNRIDGQVVRYKQHRFTLATSVGLACCKEDGDESEFLMKVADQQMYADKQSRTQK